MAKLNSPEDMMSAVSDTMKERTGKSLDEWVTTVLASGLDPLDQKAVRAWLKNEHGILQNTQWAIADAAARVAGWERPDLEAYINSQYTGPKQAIRPIFDTLREIIEGLGDDVHAEGRGGYTPFVRTRQFVAIQAATKERLDLGLRFKQAPQSSLLVEAKAPGQSTHKIGLSSPDQITGEIIELIRLAYEQNG